MLQELNLIQLFWFIFKIDESWMNKNYLIDQFKTVLTRSNVKEMDSASDPNLDPQTTARCGKSTFLPLPM